VRAVVDSMLFIDEAPLPAPVRGSAAFAQVFASRGQRDDNGRSLRDLDLRRRLFRYPCSYLIESAIFDDLPAAARDAVFERLWAVLSGREKSATYARLSAMDRLATVEILRATKKDLPGYFWGKVDR
ncbi:MAG: hypothetical protein ABUS56_10980, partial [Acidobacteriota bacterium]